MAAAGRAELTRWIDARLKSYGKDPRLLTGEAFRAYVDGEMRAAREQGDAARVALLEVMRAAWAA